MFNTYVNQPSQRIVPPVGHAFVTTTDSLGNRVIVTTTDSLGRRVPIVTRTS